MATQSISKPEDYEMTFYLGRMPNGLYGTEHTWLKIQEIVIDVCERRGVNISYFSPGGIGAAGVVPSSVLLRIAGFFRKLYLRLRRELAHEHAYDVSWGVDLHLGLTLKVEQGWEEMVRLLVQMMELSQAISHSLTSVFTTDFQVGTYIYLYPQNRPIIIELQIDPRALEKCTLQDLDELAKNLKERSFYHLKRNWLTGKPQNPSKNRQSMGNEIVSRT